MKRIKIVKIYDHYDDYSDEVLKNKIFSDGIDWHEIDDFRFKELNELILFANASKYELNSDYNLLIIEETPIETVELFLEKALKLREMKREKLRVQKEKEEKSKVIRDEKRKATELERKRKQLEKLQKELDGQ